MDEFFILFQVYLGKARMLGEWKFYLFVLGVNQVEWESEWVQDFLFSPKGFESFHSDLPQVKRQFSVCGVFVHD